MHCLVDGLRLCGAEGPFVVFSTFDHKVDEVEDVGVQWQQGAVEGVL